LSAATSFYALHELYIFALDNAPDFAEGSAFGKAALEKVLRLPIQILPFVSRVERMRHARRLLLHTTNIFQPFPISFHTRLPKIILNASMTDKRAGDREKTETEPKIRNWFQDLTRLST
jgi:hypothetical protein